MGYASLNMPQFNSVSVSGYHTQEDGADAALELAFTISDGLEYVRMAVEVADLKVDDVAPRLSFFLGIGMNFYTEIAKMRAGRRMCVKLMKERYKPQNSNSLLLRAHCLTSGYYLTECQPSNNVVRTTVEAMAAVMGGTESLHTNPYDEAVGLPTVQSFRVARNTQLILREETGMTDVADPWGGSYMMESLTENLYNRATDILRYVEEAGREMMRYIESGRSKIRVKESSVKKQGRIYLGRDVVVGVKGG